MPVTCQPTACASTVQETLYDLIQRIDAKACEAEGLTETIKGKLFGSDPTSGVDAKPCTTNLLAMLNIIECRVHALRDTLISINERL